MPPAIFCWDKAGPASTRGRAVARNGVGMSSSQEQGGGEAEIGVFQGLLKIIGWGISELDHSSASLGHL